MRTRHLLVLAFTMALLPLVPTPALAQGTTGSLIGTVRDSLGGVLPGVRVTIASASLIGGPKGAVTGPDGRFAFTYLDPGAYDVRCELDGFKTEEIKGVQVILDRAAEVLPKLEVGGLAESLTVTTDLPAVDTTRAGVSSVYSLDYLERASIGSQGRSYQVVIGRTPGADNGNGNPHFFGSTDNENAYYVDGLDTTDPVTGTFSTNLNFDAIKEISVQAAGFPAEFGRATGGVVNIVTKSGGNRFSGTFDVRYNDTSLDENGRHFNRDQNKTELLRPSATLGGPVLRDRLWFFLAGEYVERKTTPTGSALTQDRKGGDYLGKLSWQVDPSWHAAAKYYAVPTTVYNFNAGPFVEPAVASEQKQPNHLFQAEVNGLLTSRLSVEAQAAVNRAEIDRIPQSGNLDLPGITDQVTGISSSNYFNVQFSRRQRDELQAAITGLADHLAGSHDVKLGASYSNMGFQAVNNLAGGAYYLDYNGPIDRNAILELQQPLDPARFTGKLYSTFLQDAWRPAERLTIQLGARYDDVRFRNDAGVQISDQHYLQPRLGFAYDLTGDAKTALRASYGIFMSPSELTLPLDTAAHAAPQLFYEPCSAFFATAAACAAASRFGAAGYLPSDPLHRDPLGYLETREVGAASPEFIDPGLKPMTYTHYTVGIERQLWDRASIELSYVRKRSHDIIEDTCSENVPTPTADPQGTTCSVAELANLPAAKRDYQGAVLAFNSRAGDWLSIKASYVYSRSRGSVEDDQNTGADFDIYPTFFINRYGYLSDDRRHRVRLDGYVRLPLDFSVGLQSDYSSPSAYSKTTPALYDVLYLAPRGSFRANSNYNVNLEVRKGFLLGAVHTELIASVLNLLGSEQANGVCGSALGCNGIYPFGARVGFTQPRHYEVGVRAEF
jgi:TonB dependent receptor-like, beta-barrel/Carboxypeptidase regulatory-like domain